ncbi:MAG: CBS domain-containing protein [Candidatus Hadarchaeota archaeon]
MSRKVPHAPVRQSQLALVKAETIMNKRPRTVRPNTSIDGLVERLLGQIEGCFPVVDKNQKLIGIVTESDVIQVLHAQTPSSAIGNVSIKLLMKRTARTVGDIMTKRPISVTPDTTVEQILNLMVSNKLRRLPVVEDEKLVGLVSLRDVVELYRVMK